MRDIPLFTATDGMATLIFREIPYRKEAYVWIRTVYGSLEGLMTECVGFCRAAGAERVYFSGNADFTGYPIYARLIYRSLPRMRLPATKAVAIPAKDEALWLAQYRKRFLPVPAASSTPSQDGLYDILLDGQLIGIGQVQGGMIPAVASLEKGQGVHCLCALGRVTDSPLLRLVCAEENRPAMRLYDKLGFSRDEEKEVWYSMK
jgi:hypothetical protein